MNLNDIYFLNIKSTDYCCISSEISKSEAINLLKNIDLAEKVGRYKKINIKSNFEAINLLEILI